MSFYGVGIIFLTIIFVPSNALKCYTCTSTIDDIDEACINDPASVTVGTPITDCNKKYCISIRQEYVDPKGKVASMARTCVDEPIYNNNVVEDATYRTYYRACTTELCNGGPGTDLSTLHNNEDNGEATIIYVRGTGSASKLLGSIGLVLVTQIYLWF